ARTADAFAARAAEGQGRVDLVLDLDQRVENHRPARRQIDLIGIDARIRAIIRAPAIDAEFAHLLRSRLGRKALAPLDLRIFRKCKLSHDSNSPSEPLW